MEAYFIFEENLHPTTKPIIKFVNKTDSQDILTLPESSITLDSSNSKKVNITYTIPAGKEEGMYEMKVTNATFEIATHILGNSKNTSIIEIMVMKTIGINNIMPGSADFDPGNQLEFYFEFGKDLDSSTKPTIKLLDESNTATTLDPQYITLDSTNKDRAIVNYTIPTDTDVGVYRFSVTSVTFENENLSLDSSTSSMYYYMNIKNYVMSTTFTKQDVTNSKITITFAKNIAYKTGITQSDFLDNANSIFTISRLSNKVLPLEGNMISNLEISNKNLIITISNDELQNSSNSSNYITSQIGLNISSSNLENYISYKYSEMPEMPGSDYSVKNFDERFRYDPFNQSPMSDKPVSVIRVMKSPADTESIKYLRIVLSGNVDPRGGAYKENGNYEDGSLRDGNTFKIDNNSSSFVSGNSQASDNPVNPVREIRYKNATQLLDASSNGTLTGSSVIDLQILDSVATGLILGDTYNLSYTNNSYDTFAHVINLFESNVDTQVLLMIFQNLNLIMV